MKHTLTISTPYLECITGNY